MISFDKEQLEIIRDGIEKGLNVKWYFNPLFTCEQMLVIKKGVRVRY